VYVVREPEGDTVYEAPDAAQVPELVGELVSQINASDGLDPTVLGAMAHLNLTMIHPFKDGNGRMARALQTLVLAKDGIVSPVLSSIEEWLGRNTDAYYAQLADVGQGSWHPEHDALPWVRFCLRGHFQQAATVIRRNIEVGRIWLEIERIRSGLGLPERTESPLMDAAFGYKVRNQRYREENEISDVVASRDLKKLTDVGFLEPVGEKRGRYYVAGKPLKDLVFKNRERRQVSDPYELAAKKAASAQLELF
jgi:Fic family protein